MDAIKLATPEQVERIRAKADLGTTSSVYALGEDIAVLKNVSEIDPVFFAEGSTTQRKLLFIWGLENHLRLLGIDAYYFNTKADDSAWRKVVETHGAEAISESPEIRYKVRL